MKLYHRPDCPFCWKVRIYLIEAGIEVRETAIKLGERHPDIMANNPNGTVPMLVDGDLILWESAVIIEYLAEKFPKSSLMSGSPEQRAEVRQIHSYSDHNLGKSLFPYIKQLRESAHHKATDELYQSTSLAWHEIQKRLAIILDRREFFGDGFSAAECALLPRFALALAYGLTWNEGNHSLKEWFRRCVKRPSFSGSYPAALPRNISEY
ncbi:MAG: glutathione S-transferase [Alphaproteobacteria bacterium]|nr:MAG: glutathione S-transferase [Alphaproteobacteria bacterium]